MRELQFERLSDDGAHLVLVDSRGVQYTLPVDESLAASVRRGLQRSTVRSAPGNITPRDIQALIRQGHSIEDVAARTGLAEDFVQRFAEPVMAEMDFVIQRARRLSIHSAGQQVPVEDLVDRAARRADVPVEELMWSCRKTEDSTWRIDASTTTEDVLSLIFRVSEGTLTPADAATADLVKPRRVVDITETGQPALPRHWDAQHPAARAAARSAATSVEPVQPALTDDPSRIF
ncbi:MAG: septation protein SepH [Candidatus Nanopelagicales bacterium]